MSVFLSLSVVSLECRSISPILATLAVLAVILPVAFVERAVSVLVGSKPISLVLFPFTFEEVPVCMPELALSVCLVVLPVPLVLRAVWPCLSSVAVSRFLLPLP